MTELSHNVLSGVNTARVFLRCPGLSEFFDFQMVFTICDLIEEMSSRGVDLKTLNVLKSGMDMKTAIDERSEHLLDTAARLAGGRLTLARRLGVSAAAIGNWKIRGAIPIEHCAAIEQATGGSVTRVALRPDDWQRIWPELADSAQNPAIPSVERSFSATESVAPANHPDPSVAA